MKPTSKILQNLAYGLLLMSLLLSVGSTISRPCNWNQYQGDEAHSAYNDSDIVPPLHLIWKRSLERGGISGSPVASGNRLVVLSPLGTVMHDYALLCYEIKEDGLQLIWQRSLSMVEPGTTPAIVGNTVVCPSNRMLHCFDLETGHTIWEFEFYSSPLTPVVIRESNTLVVTTKSGGLSLVDTSTGEIGWTQKSLKDVPCYFFNVPVVGDERIFVNYSASDEDGIAAFDLQGTFLWKRTEKLFHKCADDNPYITLYTGGTLFVVGIPTILFALDDDTGDILWVYEEKGLLNAFSSDGKNIYVYSRTDEGVLCLDVNTGEEIWKSPPLFPGDKESLIIIDKSLVSTKKHVFVCRHTMENIGSDQIFALDSATGELVWTSEKIDDLKGPLILCNDMLIAKTSTALYAFGQPSQATSVPPSAPPESTPPDTSPPATEPSPHIPEWYLIVVAGIIIGILIYYVWQKHK